MKISKQNLFLEKIPNIFFTKLRFVGKLLQLALKLLCCGKYWGSLRKAHETSKTRETKTFVSEMHIDWNGPVVSEADNVLARSLDKKFGSRKKWNFKSSNTKFYTSAVVDRKKV